MGQQMLQAKSEWLKVLGKGMVTIPKRWRDELRIEIGGVVKARKLDNRVIIEPMEKQAPYRIYSRAELKRFLADDRL